jgi:hypothetical protein
MNEIRNLKTSSSNENVGLEDVANPAPAAGPVAAPEPRSAQDSPEPPSGRPTTMDGRKYRRIFACATGPLQTPTHQLKS